MRTRWQKYKGRLPKVKVFGSRALEAVDLRHRSESVRSQDDAPGLGPALTWRTISKLLSVVQGRDVLF